MASCAAKGGRGLQPIGRAWLCEIDIATSAESAHLLVMQRPAAEGDNRDAFGQFVRLQAPGDLPPIQIGQLQIEQYEIGLYRFCELQNLGAALEREHAESRIREIYLISLTRMPVILDDEQLPRFGGH